MARSRCTDSRSAATQPSCWGMRCGRGRAEPAAPALLPPSAPQHGLVCMWSAGGPAWWRACPSSWPPSRPLSRRFTHGPVHLPTLNTLRAGPGPEREAAGAVRLLPVHSAVRRRYRLPQRRRGRLHRAPPLCPARRLRREAARGGAAPGLAGVASAREQWWKLRVPVPAALKLELLASLHSEGSSLHAALRCRATSSRWASGRSAQPHVAWCRSVAKSWRQSGSGGSGRRKTATPTQLPCRHCLMTDGSFRPTCQSVLLFLTACRTATLPHFWAGFLLAARRVVSERWRTMALGWSTHMVVCAVLCFTIKRCNMCPQS